MANNVEELGLVITGDTEDASSALVALNNQLQGLQSNLIKLERQTKNYSKEFGDGTNKISDALGYAIPKINKINELLATKKTGWGEVKGIVTSTNNEIRTYENLITVINKQLKEQKAIEESGLKTQREILSLQSARARINSIDVTTAKDALSKLRLQKKEIIDNLKIARQYGDDEASKLKLQNSLISISKKIQAEKLAIIDKMVQSQNKLNETSITTSNKNFNKEVADNVKWLEKIPTGLTKYTDTLQTSVVKAKNVIEDMTKKNPVIQDMSKYYSNLEKESIKETQSNYKASLSNVKAYVAQFEQASQNYGKTMLSTRKAIIEDMTKKTPIQQDMSKYYSELEKGADRLKNKQAQLNKANLEDTISRAKSLLQQNAEASLLNTTLGKMKLKSQEMITTLKILQQQEKTEENLKRIEALRTDLAIQGNRIRAQRAKESEQELKQQERASQYDGVLSMHSAKRAIGYSVLFGSIAAVTAIVSKGLESLVAYDKALYQFQAVLDATAPQAKKLEDSLQSLSTFYGQNISDLNEVALALGRAGIAYGNVADATKVVTQLAILTGDTVEASSGAVSTFLQLFSKDDMGRAIYNVNELGAKMAYMANSSRMSVADINTFINYAGAMSVSAGLTVNAVGAMATAFSEAGKASSTIGTNVRRFAELLGSTEPKIQEFFRSVGVNQANLQKEMLKGGEASDKAFKGFLTTLGGFSRETLAIALNGMQVLDRDTLATMAVTSEKMIGHLGNVSTATRTELDKADTVAQSFETRIKNLMNTISGGFQQMQPVLGLLATGLEGILKNIIALGGAVATILLVKQGMASFKDTTREATLAVDLLSKAFRANPILLGVSATILGVAGAMSYLSSQTDEATSSILKLTSAQLQKRDMETLGQNYAQLSQRQQELIDKRKELGEGWFKDTVGTQITTRKLTEEIEALDKQKTAIEGALNNIVKENNKQDEVKTKQMKAQYSTGLSDINKKLYDEAKALTNNPATKDIGERLINDLAKSIKSQADIVLPDTFKNTIWESQAKGLSNLSGEAYMKGVATLKANVIANVQSIETEINNINSKLATTTDESIRKGLQESLDVATTKANEYKSIQDSIGNIDGNLNQIYIDRNTELKKGAGAAKDASKELYKMLEAEKAIASLNLEISQYQEGSYGTALGQAQVAKLELDFAKKNLETAILAKAEATEIAKLKRDISKAELESLKANDVATKQALEQKQAWEDIGLAWQQFMDSDTSPLTESLISAQNNARKLQEQIDAGGLNSIDLEKKKQDLLLAQLDIKKAQLALEIESIELKANKGLRVLEAQAAQYERMSIIRESMANTDNAHINNALKFADVAMNTANRENALQQERIKLNEQYDRDVLDTSKNQAEVREKYLHDDKLLKEKAKTSEIAGYGQIAGAIGAMFQQGSKEAEAFQRIQAGLAMVNAVNAVLMAGATMPTPANFASMASMAGMVASVLANASIAFKGIGGTKTTTSSDKLSKLSANEGTGTILGDTKATSDSIVKSLSLLEDYKKPEFQTLQSMNKYLANISNSIGGVSALIVQTGGYAFGEGFTATDSGWKNKVSTDMTAVKAASLGGAGIQDLVMASGGGLGLALPMALGTLIVDKFLLGGTIGNMTNKILGGIFGKTSVTTKLKDSGMYFADQLLVNAKDEIYGGMYQAIETTTSKKSWFSKSTSTSTKTKSQDMAGFTETERQFSLILSNMYGATQEAGKALDMMDSDLTARLNSFVVSIGKVSLKKLNGQQIQEKLTAIFGAVGDNLARHTFPLLESFQQIGEGLFTTMTRVAKGMEEAEFYIERLGVQFKDLPYWEVINKQGDIGFEALLQSIVKTDEAAYGLNNNLVQVIGNLDSTAEELYNAYTALDLLRETLKFLKLNTDAISTSTIRGAGGIDALGSGMSAYVENFLTENEQLAYNTNLLIKEFGKLNLALPVGKEGFTSLIKGLDLSTESGQELYGRLIILSESFASVADKYEESITQLEDSLKSEFDVIIGGFDKVFASIQDNINKTQSLIDKLIGKSNNEDTSLVYNLIEYNKALSGFMSTGDQSSLDALLKYADQASNLGGNIPVIVEDLKLAMGGLTTQEEVIRVNIVDGLGDLLGLTEDQTAQLKLVAKDGKVTNNELDSISGLSKQQKDGIQEFVNNSNYFSTEETLSSLTAFAQAQLAVLQQNQEAELSKLSSKTFEYGDYIGKQEQIDIAKTLGVSYDTAKPLIEQLQGLSVSNNLSQDVGNILGYSGYEYDINKASQISKLSGFLSPDVANVLSNIQSQSSINIADRTKREQFASEALKFNQQLAAYEAELSSRLAQIAELQKGYDYWKRKDEGDGEGKAYKPAKNAAKQAIEDNNASISRLQNLIPTLYAEKAMRGYSNGGYTGDGGRLEPAGIVHRGEYVVNSNTTKDLGLNQGRGGVFKEMLDELKVIKEENINMKKLLVKLTADNSKMLNLERATYSQTIEGL